MVNYFSYAMFICALLVATGNCAPKYAQPQSVPVYTGSAQVLSGPVQVYEQPVVTSQAQAAAPQAYGAAPVAAPAYSQAAPAQYAAPIPPPAAYPSSGLKYSVQPLGVAQLYAGQNNYKTYPSPPEYSRVVLPVQAGPEIARLYVPQSDSVKSAY